MQPPNQNSDLADSALAIIADILASAKPGADGAPDDEAWAQVQQVLDYVEQQSAPQEARARPTGKLRVPNLLAHPTPGLRQFLSLEEAYGTEPPGEGWTAAGTMRWTRPAQKPPKHVAVIGGGPGGLFATYILNQKAPEVQVTLFEASGRLGGKIKTDRFSDGTPFESGVAELYEYLGPGGKDPLRRLIEQDLGLVTNDMTGGGVILGENVLRSLDDVEALYGPETRGRIERFHEKMTKLMSLEQYATRWQIQNDHPWAPKTFHECLLEEIPDDQVARAYITTAVHSDLATEPHTCNGLNAVKNVLMDNPEYMQLYHVQGGIERIVEALVAGISATVNVQHRVTGIRHGGCGYWVRYRNPTPDYDKDREECFDAVLVCLPNHWLTQVRWDDPLLAQAMHGVCAHYDLPAHYLRVSFLFRSAWWKHLGMPGDYFILDCFNGCAVYDESTRWRSVTGHVLSFLLAGQDALLMCSANQSDAQIAECVLDRLPDCMKHMAKAEMVEARVERYAGSINAQPGGYPAEEVVGEHQPEEKNHPGVFLVGDYFFDSTLNAALISAGVAVDLLVDYLGVEAGAGTPATAAVGVDSGTV
jgi:monoamine oxidase